MSTSIIINSIIIVLALVSARANYVSYKRKQDESEFWKEKYNKMVSDYLELNNNVDELSQMISTLRAENDKMTEKLFDYQFNERKGFKP